MKSVWRRISVILVVFAMLGFWGCSNKVTQENYKKIEIGMSYEEVTSILGEPVKCESVLGAQSCDWGDDARMISLKFVADNVVFRSAQGLQ